MKGRGMKLSVEISTYNRKHTLRRVLQKLAKQTFPASKFEVVISDDGSTDGTIEMIHSIKEEFPFDIRLLSNEHLGCGGNHNQGIHAAGGEIVLMLADDILPEPCLLSEHMKIHDKYPESSVVVCGHIRQALDLPETPFQKSWDKIANNMFMNERRDLKHGGFLVSNISFKKEFIVDNGMFKNWPSGSGEDLELGFRLHRCGMKLITNPAAMGYHYHPESLESVAKRSYMHGYNWHNLEKHVPETWVRYRSENIVLRDGLLLFFKIQIKKLLRHLFLNHLFNLKITEPLLKKCEQKSEFSFAIPFLTGKVASYYFHKGVQDNRQSKAMGFVKANG